MVALSGDNYYFGRLVKKPQIGDDIRELETEDIKRSNLLLYITAFLMVVMVSVIRLVLLLQVIFKKSRFLVEKEDYCIWKTDTRR